MKIKILPCTSQCLFYAQYYPKLTDFHFFANPTEWQKSVFHSEDELKNALEFHYGEFVSCPGHPKVMVRILNSDIKKVRIERFEGSASLYSSFVIRRRTL